MGKYKMYFLTLNSLSGIQKGIQCGHAALEYANKYSELPDYKQFITYDKTWVLLNGGSANSNKDNPGTMENHFNYLHELNINNSVFYEPDLNNALTAISFLVPEIVYDRNEIANFDKWISIDENIIINYDNITRIKIKERYYNNLLHEDIKAEYDKCYLNWCNKLGGLKYGLLREFINKFRTA